MTNRHPSKALIALLSLSLIFIGSGFASAATYPPTPGEVLPPAPGNIGPIIGKVPPLSTDDKVIVPTAPESHLVIVIKVNPPTAKNIESLHGAILKAVEVETGLVLGGVRYSSAIPKVVVDSKSNVPTEIQTPRGTPVVISLRGYAKGQKVDVIVTQNGKSVNLGPFTANANGYLTLPTATVVGSSNETFSFKSKGKSEKVILRPIAPKSGFSTAKVSIHK